MEEDIKDFMEAAVAGDECTLQSITGWDEQAIEKEMPAIIRALLNGNLQEAEQIAQCVTSRVAYLYAVEQYGKRYDEGDQYA